jgi:hypothetical protein
MDMKRIANMNELMGSGILLIVLGNILLDKGPPKHENILLFGLVTTWTAFWGLYR